MSYPRTEIHSSRETLQTETDSRFDRTVPSVRVSFWLIFFSYRFHDDNDSSLSVHLVLRRLMRMVFKGNG